MSRSSSPSRLLSRINGHAHRGERDDKPHAAPQSLSPVELHALANRLHSTASSLRRFVRHCHTNRIASVRIAADEYDPQVVDAVERLLGLGQRLEQAGERNHGDASVALVPEEKRPATDERQATLMIAVRVCGLKQTDSEGRLVGIVNEETASKLQREFLLRERDLSDFDCYARMIATPIIVSATEDDAIFADAPSAKAAIEGGIDVNLWRTFAKREHEANHDELLATASKLRAAADLLDKAVTRAKTKTTIRIIKASVALAPSRLAKLAASVTNAFCQASHNIE